MPAPSRRADADGGTSLYAFSVEELYDYDLPNIHKPSAHLTAMTAQRLRSPVRGGRTLPPLEGRAGADAAAPVADPTAEDDGDESEEGKLKTGDEAANFFARHGNHTPVKFVHLNRAKSGDIFRPYDLVVVSREQVITTCDRDRRVCIVRPPRDGHATTSW